MSKTNTAEDRRRLFDEALAKARELNGRGYPWLASLYVNRARVYGTVTRRHLREAGIKQEARTHV